MKMIERSLFLVTIALLTASVLAMRSSNAELLAQAEPAAEGGAQ